MTNSLPGDLLTSLRGRLRARVFEARADIDKFILNPNVHLAQSIQQAAHKMAGIAATLGYEDLGNAAATLDREPPSCPPSAVELARLQWFRAALCEAEDGSI